MLYRLGVLIWLELSGATATTFRDHVPRTRCCWPRRRRDGRPLLLFAACRVPLVTIGLLQFVTPILQPLCGVLLLGEAMTPTRWTGFGIDGGAGAAGGRLLRSARSRSQARARDRSQRASDASLTR